jgi:ankyrin repeat protein
MAAACFGRIKTVRILLELHVPVNAQSTEGLTALAEAAIAGEADILTLLLRAGADPAIKDGEGKSALDLAVRQGHDAAAAILKKAQPDRPLKTTFGAAN